MTAIYLFYEYSGFRLLCPLEYLCPLAICWNGGMKFVLKSLTPNPSPGGRGEMATK
jgi:hypothetical protein